MELSLKHKSQDSVKQAPRRESQSSLTYPSRTIVHAKLEMTEPGDHDEQEADAVANTIVSGGKVSRKISGGGGSSGIAVSTQMESQLSQLQGGGRQMPEGLRNMMESGFGQDFSQVRLHTDSEAASMSSSIHAKAFTLGNDIYFNRGQFSPETTEGQRLVAHELTHVTQGTGKVGRQPLPSNNAYVTIKSLFKKNPTKFDSIWNIYHEYKSKFEMDDKDGWNLAHFFTQASYENPSLSFEEKLSYSVYVLASTWKKFSDKNGKPTDLAWELGSFNLDVYDDFNPNNKKPKKASSYWSEDDKERPKHPANPEKIANYAYAGLNGNAKDPEIGDGWKYRGRGVLQLTGKSNYKKRGDTIKSRVEKYKVIDLVNNPDIVAKDDEIAVLSGMAFWRDKELHKKCINEKDANVITKIIKGKEDAKRQKNFEIIARSLGLI